MKKDELKGYFEIKSFIEDKEHNFDQKKLLNAMDISQVHTFGNPIGIVIHGNSFKPASTNDGIKAEIDANILGESYEFWKLTKNGDLYIISSLFEDRRGNNLFFLDSRTIRTTEAFMRVARLYQSLGLNDEKKISIELTYSGLKDRILSVASPNRFIGFEHKCNENSFTQNFTFTIKDISEISSLKEIVFEFIRDMFLLFDFFESDKKVVTEISEAYFNGKVT